MTQLDNLESIENRFDEVKNLIVETKSEMMKGEDCNNQLYSIIHSLDVLSDKIDNIGTEKYNPSDEFTILQTNVLEVKKELAGMSQCVEEIVDKDLKQLLATLTEKVNRLEILTNNSGINQQMVQNASGELELHLTNTIQEGNMFLKNDLKECVGYLEDSYKAISEDAVAHITEDITLLGVSVEKTADNLKRSIIDIFSRIQNLAEANPSSETVDSSIEGNIEMLKNGIYNLNVNTEQRFTKLNRLIEEMDIFKKLEGFSRLVNMPAIGQLKQTLNNKLSDIVDKYSYTLQTSQDRDELNTTTHQFKKEVYGALTSMLGTVSEYLIDSDETGFSNSQLNDFADKIDELTSVTELNNSGYGDIQTELSDLNERCQKIQESIKGFNETYLDIKTNILEIQARGETLKKNNSELSEVVRECAKSVIESSEPDRNTIKNLLSDIKKNISILQSGDEESDYTYSMQDIESDVAKIRIYLNELSQNGFKVNTDEFTDELNNIVIMVDSIKQYLLKIDESDIANTLSKMNEDVTSISTRVNKLILTSDDSQNKLKSALKEFKTLSEDIDEQIKAISSVNRFKTLENSMASVISALNESNNYNSVINQSLIMLAEWVDSAGEMLTDIQTKQSKLESIDDLKMLFVQNSDNLVSNVNSILNGLGESINSIPKPIDYTDTINSLTERISEQNSLIKTQESRLNKLDEKLSTVLEFIAKSDVSELSTKISNIDSKLEKLNNSIEKITSFVSED